jgi:hypothetical protein
LSADRRAQRDLSDDSCALYIARRSVVESLTMGLMERTLLAVVTAVLISLMVAPHNGGQSSPVGRLFTHTDFRSRWEGRHTTTCLADDLASRPVGGDRESESAPKVKANHVYEVRPRKDHRNVIGTRFIRAIK